MEYQSICCFNFFLLKTILAQINRIYEKRGGKKEKYLIGLMELNLLKKIKNIH